MTKLPKSYITKGRLCPVCGNRTLFINQIQKDLMQCTTCHYKHDKVNANSSLSW